MTDSQVPDYLPDDLDPSTGPRELAPGIPQSCNLLFTASLAETGADPRRLLWEVAKAMGCPADVTDKDFARGRALVAMLQALAILDPSMKIRVLPTDADGGTDYADEGGDA
jgi:hypothetical protein